MRRRWRATPTLARYGGIFATSCRIRMPRQTDFAIEVAGAAAGAIGVKLRSEIERVGGELGLRF